MHEYYHPSSNPFWVNDDWIRNNTEWDPDTTPLTTFADNGFYRVATEEPDQSIHCVYIYSYVWDNRIESPYCLRYVSEYVPYPLNEAKQNMIDIYPDYTADIKAATSTEELQEIYNSIQ